MTAPHLCPGYRITILGIECGKSLASVSRTHPSPSLSNISESSWSGSFHESSNSTALAAQCRPRPRIQLQSLPNELINYVFGFLDNCGPSFSKHEARPSLNLTQSLLYPLKSLSLTCQTLRSLIIPRLFAFVCLDPATLTDFLAFSRKHNLSRRIISVVAILKRSENHLTHPLWWARLLKTLRNLTWFSILASPLTLGSLLNIPIPDAEAWAFNMPYHLLRLRRSTPTLRSESDVGMCTAGPSLFTFSDWEHLILNEGSSLKAYSLYEYFLRKTPSLLASIKSNPGSSDLTSHAAGSMFGHLESFKFIAIFPFYNHVDDVLKHVRRMTNLKTFVTQLSTRADVDAISDEHVDETRKLDMNDCWMELSTAYDLILHTVLFLAREGQLQRWEAKDVTSISGIRDELVSKAQDRLGVGWNMEFEGVWAKVPNASQPVAESPDELLTP